MEMIKHSTIRSFIVGIYGEQGELLYRMIAWAFDVCMTEEPTLICAGKAYA